jgi:hypothetical protein
MINATPLRLNQTHSRACYSVGQPQPYTATPNVHTHTHNTDVSGEDKGALHECEASSSIHQLNSHQHTTLTTNSPHTTPRNYLTMADADAVLGMPPLALRSR